MISLAPMNAEEFSAYIERAVCEYAQDKVSSGQWSGQESLELSRQGYRELLPDGLSTADNYLLVASDVKAGEVVGMLWYAVQERAARHIAYVYDVLVEPAYQRMGYGTRIFEWLEVEVGRRGLSGIALHVFGHNRAAQALYAKLGYQATNINMFKSVPSAGT